MTEVFVEQPLAIPGSANYLRRPSTGIKHSNSLNNPGLVNNIFASYFTEKF